MLLAKLKTYLSYNKEVTLSQIACDFNREPIYIQQLLRHWEVKGKVIVKDTLCSSLCNGCSFITQKYYWQE